MHGPDLGMLESARKRRIRLLRLLSKILTLGSALIAKWVGMTLGTPTMITAAFGVTIVASAGRTQMIIGIGGGSVMVVTTENIRSSTWIRKETKLAAHRCQDMRVFALIAMKCAAGILPNIISGIPRSRSQQLWMRRLRPLCDQKPDTEVVEANALLRREKNQIEKGKRSRKLTRRGRFRRVIRLRLARRQLPPKPLLPRRRLSPKPLLPRSWEELS